MNKDELRNLIIQELKAAIEEDALVSISNDKHIRGNDMDTYNDMYEGDMCEQCGSKMYEGECSECGYMKETFLNESNCGGCGCCPDCESVPVHGIGSTILSVDFPKHRGVEKYSHNNYMAKPALYKVAKYAYKLLQMIPDGYELDDWQRTKIAQISDDISEVYHSLDYDFRDHE